MTKRHVGRLLKKEKASHCCMVRFTDTEFARFLTLYEQSDLHPEFQSSTKFYLEELDEFPTRTKDPYDISSEDRKLILNILPYWEDKSMQDISESALPAHTVDLISDNIITVGLTNGVSGETTCDHEKLLRVGLKGYMEECQSNIAAQ